MGKVWGRWGGFGDGVAKNKRVKVGEGGVRRSSRIWRSPIERRPGTARKKRGVAYWMGGGNPTSGASMLVG